MTIPLKMSEEKTHCIFNSSYKNIILIYFHYHIERKRMLNERDRDNKTQDNIVRGDIWLIVYYIP